MYIGNNLQLLKDSLFSDQKNELLPIATSLLSPQPKPTAYSCTAFADKLTCTDYVDCRELQDRCGKLCWSEIDHNYLHVQERLQQGYPTGTKSHCEKGRNQSFCETTETAI